VKSVIEEEMFLWDITKILKKLLKPLTLKDFYIQEITAKLLKMEFYL
jgi:hypothetical protein